MVIGIIGGIGAGKSTVMEYMSKHYSVYPILADDVARNLQSKGRPLWHEISDWLGPLALRPDGELNREYIAKIVFADEDKRIYLNKLVHPAVRKEIVRSIEDKRRYFKHVAVEAALLIEEHYDEICDEFWYVDAEEEVRIERLMNSRSYTREKCLSIMDKQLSREQFKINADKVIDNSKGIEHLQKQLDVLLGDNS